MNFVVGGGIAWRTMLRPSRELAGSFVFFFLMEPITLGTNSNP